MILIIRISGCVDITGDIKEALARLNLGRKYAAVLIKPSSDNEMLLKKLRNHVAYGDVSAETIIKLIKKRGKPIKAGAKIDAEKVVSEMEKKSLSSLGVKPFFRLHPPRKGIKSKKHFGISKGVLGDHKTKINELLERML